MKKILFFISDLNYGGAQTMLYLLLKYIDKKKYDISIIVRDTKKNTSIEEEVEALGIKIQYLNIEKTSNKIKRFLKIYNAIKFINPDIIHSHLDLVYSTLYSVITGTYIIHTIHSYPDRFFSKKINLLFYVSKKIKIVGCVACVTKRIEELFHIDKRNVQTIYNPVDLEKFSVVNKKSNKNFEFVHIGRLEPIKNQKLLLEAFFLLSKNVANAKLTIIGDGILKEELIKKCKELHIDSKVTFLGNRTDINKLLPKFDAFVMSSDSECCPMAILEAMASGLPIIATNVGGIKEIVGNAGVLSKKGDLYSLYRNMRLTINKNRYRLQQISLNNVKKFKVSKIVDDYMNLYDEILNKNMKGIK